MTTAKRIEPPRVSVVKINRLVAQHEAGEITGDEAVAAMREWIGEWTPSASRYVEPDPAEVDALLAGRIRYHQVHPQNRVEAIRRLQRRDPDISAPRLAERLNVDERTIQRLRSRLRKMEDSK